MKWLCKLGFHRWRYVLSLDTVYSEGVEWEPYISECVRCQHRTKHWLAATYE